MHASLLPRRVSLTKRSSVSRSFSSALLLLALTVGCSLDVRDLQPRDSIADGGEDSGDSGRNGVSGAGNRAGASSGGSSNNAGSSAAGAAGRAGSSSTLIDGCADLDENGVGDCRETLAKNASFGADVSDWQPELDAIAAWDEANANQDLPSGSALVRAEGVVESTIPGSALRAVSQCVAVGAKQLVTVYANAFVPAGQDGAGRAEIDVFFFESGDCSGSSNKSFVTPQPLDGGVDRWLALKAGQVAEDATRSVLVKLAILKPFKAASFEARFDNVLVRTQTP